MIERQKRLKEVYEHLRKYHGVHTQIDFADAIKYSRPVISSALNGNEAYLTNKLFQNICEAYPDVFNLDYLLTGNGQLLTIREEVTNEELEKVVNPQPIDQSSLVNAALAAKDQTIAQFELRLLEKDELIKTQKQFIQNLQQQIDDLRSKYESKDFDNYTLPIGVADNKTKR